VPNRSATGCLVLVGLGGIGSQLLPSLVRYLAFRIEALIGGFWGSRFNADI
jgi:hypothetical protein